MDMSCAAWTDDSEGGHGRIACVTGETQLGREAWHGQMSQWPDKMERWLEDRWHGRMLHTCDEGTAGARNAWAQHRGMGWMQLMWMRWTNGDKGVDKHVCTAGSRDMWTQMCDM